MSDDIWTIRSPRETGAFAMATWDKSRPGPTAVLHWTGGIEILDPAYMAAHPELMAAMESEAAKIKGRKS
jgi:hypothetical protein